jgi:tRNA (cytidine/uridine-2'-O-)-methyltransferase
MFHIVLVHPEIPPNTGNIIRLCANTGCSLHLIEPMGFSMEDKQLRRAGLDYHEYANVSRHASWGVFLQTQQPDMQRLFALTTRAEHSVYDTAFAPGDWLVFGSETAGLPADIRPQIMPGRSLRLPMLPAQRSLNLSNAVAVTTYEAWRQMGFGASAVLDRTK